MPSFPPRYDKPAILVCEQGVLLSLLRIQDNKERCREKEREGVRGELEVRFRGANMQEGHRKTSAKKLGAFLRSRAANWLANDAKAPRVLH